MIGLRTYPLVFTEQARRLLQENLAYANTGGVSQHNQHCGFVPAFLDMENGAIHLSCYADGRLAPVHVFEGLPDEVITVRSLDNQPVAIRATVLSGFVLGERFYTREQARQMMETLERGQPIFSQQEEFNR